MGWNRFWKALFISILIVGFIYGALLLLRSFDLIGKEQTPNQFNETMYVKQTNYVALEEFIEQHFLENGLCRTNLLDAEQTDMASGDDVLSESVGLLLQIYLHKNEQASFDRQVQILKQHFLKANHLYQWRIRPSVEDQVAVNATLDDLRIAGALLTAAERWNKEEYHLLAQQISESLLAYCVADGRLRAFDSDTSTDAPLVYYDLLVMKQLSKYNDRWNDIWAINLQRILQVQRSGYPFFDDPWFSEDGQDEGYPMIENLMVLMHLSEVGEGDEGALSWLQDQIHGGGIYANYDRSGMALNQIESPAIYAIVSYIALLHHDEQLYHLALQKLQGMQNMLQGDYYGGFIDLSQMSAYSFDQLMAWLAYSREYERFMNEF